jgi:uncharacterized short protein YbdD (DUF466 family)
MNLRRQVKTLFQHLRSLCGDDAYERYLRHWSAHHAHDGDKPLSRKEFFRMETERKWNGVKRCC